MGKGNRNRNNREAEQRIEQPKKKIKKYRKPWSKTAKTILWSSICVLLVAGIVFASLISAGTFKRGNILVKSLNGTYDLNQQMATYMVWDALYYTGSTMWNYLSTDDKTEFSNQGITSQSQYALYYAMTGVQGSLLTSITSYTSMLKEYVAVCDYATTQGVALTKEEIKSAREGAESDIESMATSTGYTSTAFLKLYIGENVQMKDIQNAAEMQALYSKIMSQKESEVESSITEETLETYRDSNLATFYSTDYLLVTTEDLAYKNELVAAKSLNDFKSLVAKKVFDEQYKSIFNKYGTSIHTLAETALNALKDKTTGEALDAAVADQGMEMKKYTSDEIKAINETLQTKVFDTARKAYDVITVTTTDAIYVVAFKTAPANNEVTVAIKTFALDEGETYTNAGDPENTEDDKVYENFKENMFKTVLLEMELLESTEGLTLYTDEDDKNIQDMIDSFETAISKEMPEVKTQNYVSEPTADTYQDWMFDKDSKVSPVAIGAIKETSTTENNKTTYNIYIIVDPMKLDTSLLVDGGYIKFTSTTDKTHQVLAEEFFNTLTGLTGADLAAKFSANEDAVIDEELAESSVDEQDALIAWLFDPARVANDRTTIAIPNTETAEGKDNSCTYVAYFNGNKPAWKSSAKSGYLNNELTIWVDGLISQYEIKGLNRIKDQVKLEEETSSTTAAETTDSSVAG